MVGKSPRGFALDNGLLIDGAAVCVSTIEDKNRCYRSNFRTTYYSDVSPETKCPCSWAYWSGLREPIWCILILLTPVCSLLDFFRPTIEPGKVGKKIFGFGYPDRCTIRCGLTDSTVVCHFAKIEEEIVVAPTLCRQLA